MTSKNTYNFNQYWIDKAIEDGRMNLIPVRKLKGKSIGEHIELKYRQLYNEEFEKHYHNGTLEEYNHLMSESPKITKSKSLLYKIEMRKRKQELKNQK